jgi:ketosteroid isomerase-like protein
MAANDVELVRGAWAAVDRGDVATIASVFSEDIRWHGLNDPDSGCHGRDEAVEFVKRALANGVTAEAMDVREAGDRVVVTVQLHHPPEWGDEQEPHGEVVTVSDGEIVEIIVYANVADASRAAGEKGPPDPVG